MTSQLIGKYDDDDDDTDDLKNTLQFTYLIT